MDNEKKNIFVGSEHREKATKIAVKYTAEKGKVITERDAVRIIIDQEYKRLFS